MNSLGQILKVLRQKAGLTQDELAERVGMSIHAIGNRERGDTMIAANEWSLFAKALNASESVFEEAVFGPKVKPRPNLIPLVGSIPAGWSRVVTHCEDGDFVPAHELNAELCFACVVSGDSMLPALREGDVVVFRMVGENEESLLVDGKVVACTFHETGETSVARMSRVNERRIRLSKDNPKFKPREVNLSVDELDRIGVLVQHRKGWA
jgi:SOS-response transcriptional repressor LexA